MKTTKSTFCYNFFISSSYINAKKINPIKDKSPLNNNGFKFIRQKTKPFIIKKAAIDTDRALLLLLTKWYKCFLLLDIYFYFL